MSRIYSAFVLAAIFVGTIAAAASAAEQAPPDWLRGSGKDLEMRLQGEVLGADGKPANDVEFEAQICNNAVGKPLEASLKDGHFTIWLAVNRAEWTSMWLRASSRDGKVIACRSIQNSQLREAVTDGITLKLEPPARQVKVMVSDQDNPVAGAHVKATFDSNIELLGITDANGVAVFGFPAHQQLSYLTAWSGDPQSDSRRIGGHPIAGTQNRDPDANEQTIELGKCRDQKVRFIAKDGTPAPGIEFEMEMWTQEPDCNFLGTLPGVRMTSDANGEAVFKWYPDWSEPTFYPQLVEETWLSNNDAKMIDGVLVISVTKRAPRKQITGRVATNGIETPLGGFHVMVHSMWSEREHDLDRINTFTNADGTFSADVLADNPYMMAAVDRRYPGKIIHQTLYDSKTDKTISPELEIEKGQPVEVAVTSGKSKSSLANMRVNFNRYHPYDAIINGKHESAMGSVHWFEMTDDQGLVHTLTLPGVLEVSAYTNSWRGDEKVDVAADQPVSVKLHRKVEGERKGTVKLALAPGLDSKLDNAEIKVGALGEPMPGDMGIDHTGPNGTFDFKTRAETIGIIARTADGKAAATAKIDDWDGPIELVLQPTVDFQGQVLWKDGSPAVGRPVQANILIEAPESSTGLYQSRVAIIAETKTDSAGNYTFPDLPTNTKIALASFTDPDNIDFMNEVYLEPNENRPRAVERISRPGAPSKKVPLAERYQLNNDVYPFIQLLVTAGKQKLSDADVAFLKEHDWPSPELGKVFAIALDATGKELGREEIEVSKDGSSELARDFVRKYAPAKHDLEAEWNAAFAEAKRTNRHVWVRISGRYCAPCFALSHWLDSQRSVLEKDYVMLKIDDYSDIHAEDIAKRLTRGVHHGIPFHAIFDADGNILVDSAGPLGNVGYPSGFDGKKQLRKMLSASRQKLSDVEIDALVESVGD